MINKDLKVSKSTVIQANKNKVWEMLTNPDLISKYLYGTETITDWEEGSSILFQGSYEGRKYKDKGNVLKSVPGELLKYNYWSSFSGTEDKAVNYSDIALKIEEKGKDQVILTWTQEGYANEEGYEHSQEGLPELLKKMKEIAEEL